MTAYLIRNFMAGDAEALSAVFRTSVSELGSGDYSPAQVEAWMSRAPSPERLVEMMADERIRVVAVNPETEQAEVFADLEILSGRAGHIDMFYGAPSAHRKGVASALYKAMEQLAIQREFSRLYTEASETARGFFTRQGFTMVRRRDFELAGVAIHNYAMEKYLRLPPS
jgi:putative acetyltransferase